MATRYSILKIESFEGDNTSLRCSADGQDFLYAIVAIEPNGGVEIVDNGYRSLREARAAWPEASAAAEAHE